MEFAGNLLKEAPTGEGRGAELLRDCEDGLIL